MSTNPPSVPGFNLDNDLPPPGKPTPINNVLNPYPNVTVILRGIPIPLASDIGGAFLSDCSRNRGRCMSDAAIQEKYGIDADSWAAIIKDPAIRLAVNAEHERRVRSGEAARDAAAKLFADAPEVLGKILNSESASPKHRIDAARELRSAANVGAEKFSEETDRVIINISLGADEKPIVIDSGPLPKRTVRENPDAE